jgi:hypothetical protein
MHADEEERAFTANTLKCGTNHRALGIVSKRVEENVARAILRDLHGEGLITVHKHEWDAARGLVHAIKRATLEL